MRELRLALMGLVLGCPCVALAAPETFVINPAAGSLVVGGTFNGSPLTAQTVGSAETGYTGTLAVDVDRSAGTLSFNTTVPHAQNQPLDQQPHVSGFPGANYGLQTADGQTLIAIRSLGLFLQAQGAPFSTGSPVIPGQVGFFVDGGTLHYSTPTNPNGVADLHGFGAPGSIIGPITLTEQGGVQTLSIPIETQFSPSTNSPDTVALTLKGTLVAQTPEPGMCVLVGAGAALAFLRRSR